MVKESFIFRTFVARLAESAECAVAMDADINFPTDVGIFVDLAEHDRRYHGGHYDPTHGECKLREGLRHFASVDDMGGATVSKLNGWKAEDVEPLIDRSIAEGLIEEEDAKQVKDFIKRTRDGLTAEREDYEALKTHLADINNVAKALSWLKDQIDEIDADKAKEAKKAAENAEGEKKEGSDGFAHAPAKKLVEGYADRLAESFPTNKKWNDELKAAVGGANAGDCVKAVLADPSNIQYRPLLEAYTEHALRHPSAWTAKFMGAIETLKPDWHDAKPKTTAEKAKEYLEAHKNSPDFRGVPATKEEVLEARKAFTAQPLGHQQLCVELAAILGPTENDERKGKELGFVRDEYNAQFVAVDMGKRRGDSMCCWKSEAALIARSRGFMCQANGANNNSQGEYQPQRLTFFKSQMGYSQNYEMLNEVSTREEAVRRLRNMVNGVSEGETPTLPYPDGTMISAWTGGHCKLLSLYKGHIYVRDGYYGEGYFEVSPERAVDIFEHTLFDREKERNEMLSCVQRGDTLKKSIKDAYRSADNNEERVSPELVRAKQLLYKFAMTKRDMINERRAQGDNTEPSASDICWRAAEDKNSAKVHGTYVIKPTDDLCPELFGLLHPYGGSR